MSTANEAAVCRREIVNGEGAGTVWFVRLPDGYLLDCGYGYKADERAAEIARRFNQSASTSSCRFACSAFPMCGCEVEALSPPTT